MYHDKLLCLSIPDINPNFVDVAIPISPVRYHYIIPKDGSILLFNLKYNFEEDGRLNLYIELDDPLINILSLSDASGIIMNNKSITDFPEDAIDATEV